MTYTIITPYLIPQNLQRIKAVNIGDGFILSTIQKLLYPFKCQYLLSSRSELTDDDIDKINLTKAVILAGANQLNDNFSITPNFTLKTLEKIKVPVIPFAIGIHGDPSFNQGMSDLTKDLLKEIHQRSRFSSWRCPDTIQYLTTFLPDIADQFLMTGCSVMYGDGSLSGTISTPSSNRVIVTVTERDNFWEREVKTLNFVAKRYPQHQKILSLHQDFVALEKQGLVASAISKIKENIPLYSSQKLRFTPKSLRNYAKSIGYQIFIPQSVEQCFEFYKLAGIHYGSRLHAHLWFLSQGKPSFLTYVDNRCVGFSTSLGFPLCDPGHFADYLHQSQHSSSEVFRKHFTSMQLFTNYLKSDIL